MTKEEIIDDILFKIDQADKQELDWEDMYAGLKKYLEQLKTNAKSGEK